MYTGLTVHVFVKITKKIPRGSNLLIVAHVLKSEPETGNDLGEAFSRHRSEESVVSHISSKSNANDGTKKTLSRGAELMRLGSKNAELRRHSSEEAGNALNVKGHGIVNKDDSDFLAEKDVFKTQFEKELATKSTSSNDDDDKAIVSKLMGLQWNLLHQVIF